MFELIFEEFTQFSSYTSKQSKIPEYYKGLKYFLILGSYLVGRIPKGKATSNANILLQDSSVSKEHAIISIQKLQDGAVLAQLMDKSKYGVSVLKCGGESIVELKAGKQRQVDLHSGDIILFGTNFSTFKFNSLCKTVLVPSFVNSHNVKQICENQLGWKCGPIISAMDSQQLQNACIVLEEAQLQNMQLTAEVFYGLCCKFPVVKFEYLQRIVQRSNVEDPVPNIDEFIVTEICTSQGLKIQIDGDLKERLPKFSEEELFYISTEQLPQEESQALQQVSRICGFKLTFQKSTQAIELTNLLSSSNANQSSKQINIEQFLSDLILGKKPTVQSSVNLGASTVPKQNVVIAGTEQVNDYEEISSDDDDDQPSAVDLFLSLSKTLIEKNTQESQKKTQQGGESGSRARTQIQSEQNAMDIHIENQAQQSSDRNDGNNENSNQILQEEGTSDEVLQNCSQNNNQHVMENGNSSDENILYKIEYRNLIVVNNTQIQVPVQQSQSRAVRNYKKFVKVWPTYMQNRMAPTAPCNQAAAQQDECQKVWDQYTTYEMQVDDSEYQQQEEEQDQKKKLAEQMFNTAVNVGKKTVKRKR